MLRNCCIFFSGRNRSSGSGSGRFVPWLHDYFHGNGHNRHGTPTGKLNNVRDSRGKVVLDEEKLGALEDEMWPEPRHGAIDRQMGLERIINIYCRASTGSIMDMGYEIAKINNTLAMKEAISLKLLGVAGSAVYLFGQWLFHGDDDSGMSGSGA